MDDSASTGDHTEYAKMLGRMVRAAGRRYGEADPADLPELLALAGELDQAIGRAVGDLSRAGYSWADIAAGAGTTRQAAHKRWHTYAGGVA